MTELILETVLLFYFFGRFCCLSGGAGEEGQEELGSWRANPSEFL